MKLAAKKNKILSAIMTCVLAITLMAGFPAVKAYAASGTVYSCTINRCYAHPVTGVIEDSGGESSYATGQGMVEGCVYSNGILEVSDDGAYYLTIRMSLMDYTSGHSFQVQNVGDSGWSTPSEIGITGNGSDSNGTTADVCMRVPSENCIVRGEMYVEPMGRNVIQIGKLLSTPFSSPFQSLYHIMTSINKHIAPFRHANPSISGSQVYRTGGFPNMT